jgi:hypothetical protein
LDARSFNNGAYAANSYLFVRGSTDVHVNAVSTTPFTFLGFQVIPDIASNLINRVFANSQAWLTGFSAHFRFPGYQYTARTAISNCAPGASIGFLTANVNFSGNQYGCGVRIMNPSSVAGAYQTRICAGDDAMLGHYIGPAYLALASNDANIVEFWSNYYISSGTTALSLMAAPGDVVAAEQPLPQQTVEDTPTTSVNNFVANNNLQSLTAKVASPFEPTPPIPITSGSEGVFPSARAGGLTRSLPRAGRVNVEEVKSILDSLAES